MFTRTGSHPERTVNHLHTAPFSGETVAPESTSKQQQLMDLMQHLLCLPGSHMSPPLFGRIHVQHSGPCSPNTGGLTHHSSQFGVHRAGFPKLLAVPLDLNEERKRKPHQGSQQSHIYRGANACLCSTICLKGRQGWDSGPFTLENKDASEAVSQFGGGETMSLICTGMQ